MRKIRLNIVMIAVVLGVAGAVATKASSGMHKSTDQLYNWTHYDTDGTTVIGNNNGLSVSDAQMLYGCNGDGARCGRGQASGVPDAVINYD